MRQLLRSISLIVLAAGISAPSAAQSAPKGWQTTENGIAKATSKVTIGEVQDLAGNTAVQFITAMEMDPPEGAEFVSSGGIKDGKYVIQVKREITLGETPARSVLMLCKGGENKNRLIEVFSENSKVLDLIGGAKYAISVCAK